MSLYTLEACNKLINQYVENNGNIATIEEGVLGYGFTILYGYGLKTTVIKEVALNTWSSAHTIKMYNKTPLKYQKLIDEYENREEQ